MPKGYGRGFGGRGGGRGFGFRGSSPPWPYVGLGRGGLPRCRYFLSGAAGTPVPPGYPTYGYAETPVGSYSYGPQMTREQELGFLRNQAEAIQEELDQIEGRIKELETD